MRVPRTALVALLALSAVTACQEQEVTAPTADVEKAAFYITPPTATLLTWNFENPVTQGGVSSFVGLAGDPAISGRASQTCGGPAERLGNWMHLTRYMSPTTCYPFIDVTVGERTQVVSVTFQHVHNHNPGYPTYGGYDLELQLSQGGTWIPVAPLFRVNNANSGTVGTMTIGRELLPGSYRFRWIPRNLRWGDNTNSEFLAFNDMRLSGYAIRNRAPIAASGGPYIIDEGGQVDFSGAASIDPDDDPITHAWDLDGDGNFEVNGSTLTRTYDDDVAFTARLRVIDANGLMAEAAAAVTVRNVAPALSAIPIATILAGEAWSAVGSFTDPGADQWSAVVDYGFGSQALPLAGKTFVLGHTYTSAGTYQVVVTVTDDDDGAGLGGATVVVLSPAQAMSVLEGAIAELAASGVLPPGEVTALGASLKAAAQQLAKGNVGAAENQLKAAVNKLEAQARSKRLTDEKAGELISYIDRIVASMKKP